MTFEDMRQELTENCELAGTKVPQQPRIVRVLNRAKDYIGSQMELCDPEVFIARSTFTVAAGDASITMPTDFVRLIGLTRTDTGSDIECIIIDTRERVNFQAGQWWATNFGSGLNTFTPALYMEGAKMYFLPTTGAGSAMTLVMRYRKRITDLVLTAISSTQTYTEIPAEWHGLIVDMATMYCLPAGAKDYAQYASRVAAGVATMQVSMTRRNMTGPAYIRNVDN
jgi:hypothetical protein